MCSLYELTPDDLVILSTTTFAAEQNLERVDLQRRLRARPEVPIGDVLIVAEEFGAFTDARRRTTCSVSTEPGTSAFSN